MSSETIPHVVYHCCAINHYQEVVREHFLLLRQTGLAEALRSAGDQVRISHVGPHPHWVLEEAERQDVPARIIRHDLNIQHYETFAMLEIERLAKEENTHRPVMYFHTKGVSNPNDPVKVHWRNTMNWHVVEHWRDRVKDLVSYDAAGFNFWFHGANHFSGTFWMARADWLRRLPSFVGFHHAHGLSRYSCELYIGSAPGITALSLGCNDQVTWAPGFDWGWLLPPAKGGGPSITWVSAATSSYSADLRRLEETAKRLGPGHRTAFRELDDRGPWRHMRKLDVLALEASRCTTSHVFWIDADCEFLTLLPPSDFIGQTEPLSAVRHIAYSSAEEILPLHFKERLTARSYTYWQACLFGGIPSSVLALIASLAWMRADPRGYDEHGLNVAWTNLGQSAIHTLPCRYNAPTTFARMPHYEAVWRERSGGSPRILHHNREINK